MSIKKQCWQSVYHILQHNKDGSFATSAARQKILKQITFELVETGFQLRHIKSLKTKHIYHLVNIWKARDLSPGTVKNRLSHLRWLAKHINKLNIMPSNNVLDIPRRQAELFKLIEAANKACDQSQQGPKLTLLKGACVNESSPSIIKSHKSHTMNESEINRSAKAFFNLLIKIMNLARLERFELPTLWFEARYSIQLSYRRTFNKILSAERYYST